MPKVSSEVTTESGNALRPYAALGLDVRGEPDHRGEVAAVCPWCRREDKKFSVNHKTGDWRCLVCGEGTKKGGGNVATFLKKLWEASDESTKDYSGLAKDRGLLFPESLVPWGVCKSSLTGGWLAPAYGVDGNLTNLYRWEKPAGGKKPVLLGTPGRNAALFGVGSGVWNKDCTDVFLCESLWDGVALREVLGLSKLNKEDNTLSLTANSDASLLSTSSVLVTPGANVFKEEWAALLAGKRVWVVTHNDHPKENPPGRFNQASLDGLRRTVRLLGGIQEQPSEVLYLAWGTEGDGWNTDLKSGWDVRDSLTEGKDPSSRVKILEGLLNKFVPVKPSWVPGRSPKAKAGGVGMDLRECRSWRQLVTACKKAMHWTEGLDRAFSVMLASVVSVKAVGDQLWLKVVGPASCGKSDLCGALASNPKYVKLVSNLRGFHSGYREDGQKEDVSLLNQLRDKTMVLKDGDTLLQAPNRDQILAEARDIYDRVTTANYRNGINREYDGLNLTVIICGTSSLRTLDTSELGERCLDVVIVEEIDTDEEWEVAMRVAYRADREMAYVSNGKPETREGPEKTLMKQLAGGYINYLRENAQQLLSEVEEDEGVMRECIRLAKFVAYMRSRPSKKQTEKTERELCYRLTSQMVRLSRCLAVVMNKTRRDKDVMSRVRRVALDTARGRTMAIAKVLWEAGEAGEELKGILMKTSEAEEEETKLVRHLRRLGVVESFKQVVQGVKGSTRWRLTAELRKLYGEVVHGK